MKTIGTEPKDVFPFSIESKGFFYVPKTRVPWHLRDHFETGFSFLQSKKHVSDQKVNSGSNTGWTDGFNCFKRRGTLTILFSLYPLNRSVNQSTCIVFLVKDFSFFVNL